MRVWQAEDFWQFSLAYYQNNSEPLLQLQDKYQLNVNLCLLCLYLNKAGKAVNLEQLNALILSLAETDSALKPLRLARCHTKKLNSDIYQRLKTAELQIEKIQQQHLIQQLNQFSLLQTSGDNLVLYLQNSAPNCPQDYLQKLSQI